MSRVETIGAATLYLGDCREILPTLGKADAVVTDPPYGITAHVWDRPVPPSVWMCAPTVCFAAEPFATSLINDAPLSFKYDLVWSKNTATNYENCHVRPLRMHERILIFGTPPYTPQKRRRTPNEMLRLNADQRRYMEWANPGSVLAFDAVNNRNAERTEHQSQKPTDLMMWLLASYSKNGQIIADPFMGSGTTGVACIKLGRSFIGIEIEPMYFDIACRRIEEATRQGVMFIEQPPAWEQATLSLPG